MTNSCRILYEGRWVVRRDKKLVILSTEIFEAKVFESPAEAAKFIEVADRRSKKTQIPFYKNQAQIREIHG